MRTGTFQVTIRLGKQPRFIIPLSHFFCHGGVISSAHVLGQPPAVLTAGKQTVTGERPRKIFVIFAANGTRCGSTAPSFPRRLPSQPGDLLVDRRAVKAAEALRTEREE
jgi:hypothetical protein